MRTMFKLQDLWNLVEFGNAELDEETRLRENRKEIQRLSSSFNKPFMNLFSPGLWLQVHQRKPGPFLRLSFKACQRSLL